MDLYIFITYAGAKVKDEQVCIPVGCVPTASVAIGGEGVSAQGGVCLEGGVSAQGMST